MSTSEWVKLKFCWHFLSSLSSQLVVVATSLNIIYFSNLSTLAHRTFIASTNAFNNAKRTMSMD